MKSLPMLMTLLAAWLGALLVWSSPAVGLQTPTVEFRQLKAQAEKHYADSSYAKSHELYERAASMRAQLSAADARWVDFRLADTSWRSQAATSTSDSTIYDRARQQLETLINLVQRQEDRDLVWAEAQESLGDFWWTRKDSQNWHGWNHYQSALDWWANSGDLDLARRRYLGMVWKLAEPVWMERHYYSYYSNVPIEVLDNALKIAATDNDKAHAHYLIALTLRRHGDWRTFRRAPKEFEGALAPGKSTDWYDDALFAYGDWMMNYGVAKISAQGHWIREPDYPKALEIYRRLVREFQKGETRYWDDAQNRIKQITDPQLSVSVSNIFLPGSEIQYHLNWRNVNAIELTLHQVDLTRDIRIGSVDADHALQQWINSIDLTAAEKIKAWTRDTKDAGEHKPGQSSERLDESLPPGAYVLEASAGGRTAREIILVTDAAIVLKASGPQVVAYVCNAVNSKPMPHATVRVWKVTRKDDRWLVASSSKQADEQGLCMFGQEDFPGNREHTAAYLATAAADDRQAVAQSQGNWYSGDRHSWRIYAFTDRPAYRPGDQVQWKIIARTGSATGFQTPSGQTLHYQIDDPRGAKLSEGVTTLNEFGSAWGSVDLTESMPLGEYRVTYWLDKAHNRHVGQATLFRLEEYKLPEFKVAIATPEEDGRKKVFVLGDYVEASIQADYYFGGAVANATVEVVVYQNPHYHWWMPVRDYPWVYEDSNPYRYWGYGNGQIIKRETLKTDVTGKAVVTFETPADAQQDFDYRIEARVTDASRREIVASDSVRVGRQHYYVHATPKHYLHQPGDEVQVSFKGMDANDHPVRVEGTVKVTRQQWIEIWVDPTEREVTGAELSAVREREMIWPPPPARPDAPFWRLKFSGYSSEPISTSTVKLNEKGEAEFMFMAQHEGYYHVHWESDDHLGKADRDPNRPPVTADAAIWVATNKSTEIGYRTGQLEIVVDADTVRVGHTAPIMITVPTSDRYVLFSVEGNDLYTVQLVHVTGTVKLVNLPIEQRHVPNMYLNAMMAHDGQLHHAQKELVVPPVEQYLNVEVLADRGSAQYQPGDAGSFTVKTTDHDGKPVSAEVALAVADESVTYIQQDYAGDPRPFFFEQRQGQYVQTGSTFQQKAFIKLVEIENEQLIDERLRAQVESELRDGKNEGWRGRQAGLAGGYDELDASTEYAAKRMRKDAPGAPAARAQEAAAGDRRELSDALGENKLGMPAVGGKAIAGKPGGGPGPDGGPAVVVRSDFRATLLWQPSVTTDEDGVATVNLKYADSLTSWKATARAAGHGNQFGIGSSTTRTKMPLIARLQAPRFFVVGDTVTVSGVINNNTDEDQTVIPELNAQGLVVAAMLREGKPVRDRASAIIDIPANSEVRVDWQVEVQSPGNALLKLTATGDKYADGMEKSFIVHEHGVERFLAKSGKVRGNVSEVTVKLDIPSARKPESTVLAVQVAPSMAVTMLDALPYLVDYPYGCTEQTMSRFLPAAITAKTLSDQGIKPEVVMGKLFGGIEPAHVDKTHPKNKADLTKLDQITQASLDRLYDFQHGDGGWGWWKQGESDHFMTAYVLWGLCLAKDAGLDVRPDTLDRAASYLDSEIVEEESSYDQQAWMLHALSSHHATMKRAKVGKFQATALNNLWTNRDRLNAYTRALLALSAHHYGDAQKAQTLVDNLENGVKRDDRPDTSVIVKGGQGSNDAVMGTAHWGEDGLWWRWSDGGVEATAFALRAILAIDPTNKLVEPVSNWLIKNRRGAQWSNTRDTAIVVLTLNDYLRASGELAPGLEYEVQVNGQSVVSRKLSAEDILAAPSRFEVDRKLIRDGVNDIRIVRKGSDSPLYFAAEAKFFSLEEPIPAAGTEIFVRRDYFKLVPRPTLLKGIVYDRMPLGDGGTVQSGERVEVVMTVEAKNNYEYLVFEDLKPAGLEAVDVRSGESVYAKEMKRAGIERTFGDGAKEAADVAAEQAHAGPEEFTGRMQWVYQELRDRKVALFIDKLPEGVWEIRYDLRAETPGRFHALPVLGHAMYVPEIRANSEEIRISVTDSAR